MKKSVLYLVYALIIVILFILLIGLGHFAIFRDFIINVENSSFDIRQSIIASHKKANQDIVIIAVDDQTYEYIMDKYGSWPISRQVWSDTINNLEKVNPKYIIFDMLFLKADLNNKKADKAFVQSVKNNKNVYLSMNFDNYSAQIREPKDLSNKLKLKIKEGELVDNFFITFINARTVMKELSDATDNIGIITITRDNDGIIRNMTPIFKYKNDYYPNLSFAVALNLLNAESVSLKNNSIVIDKNHQIVLNNSQRAILNWYGKRNTFKHISLWEVIKAQKENNTKFLRENFENKIIYVGTTATSLSDIKSVPTESNMAGIEVHATFLNNILDNNFIKKVSFKTDLLISLVMILWIGFFVLKTPSVIKTITFLLVSLLSYVVFATYIMSKFNLWIGIVLPFMAGICTFVLVYCEKYLLKVKDYEMTYKLAVTDGLTQLYNHRYFQEQMIINFNNYTRYGHIFSLILIDIDFFKKFNDTYGHQSGDCVLKQVANILKKNSRTSDIVCRYGGEEMSVILTNTKHEEAVLVANKICSAVRSNLFTLANGEKANVTISAGVATSGIDNSNPQEMIEYSDKCLYKAKELGRNQVISSI